MDEKLNAVIESTAPETSAITEANVGAVNTNKFRLKVPKIGTSSRVLLVILSLVSLIGIGAAGYFWNESKTAKQQTPEAVAAKNQQESQDVVGSLSTILFIEGEDEPTVARVESPDTLKKANQEFYKNVQVGDYLVLYPQRAIIYRQAEKKIVNIAPIVNTAQSQTPQQDVAGESAEKPVEAPKTPQGSR